MTLREVVRIVGAEVLTEDELLDESLMRQVIAVTLRDLPVKKIRRPAVAKPLPPRRSGKPSATPARPRVTRSKRR